MVLLAGGIVIALLALIALVPHDRVPPWVGLYVRVALASGILVVVVALLA